MHPTDVIQRSRGSMFEKNVVHVGSIIWLQLAIPCELGQPRGYHPVLHQLYFPKYSTPKPPTSPHKVGGFLPLQRTSSIPWQVRALRYQIGSHFSLDACSSRTHGPFTWGPTLATIPCRGNFTIVDWIPRSRFPEFHVGHIIYISVIQNHILCPFAKRGGKGNWRGRGEMNAP